jgi:type I restriction enzyme S subunit
MKHDIIQHSTTPGARGSAPAIHHSSFTLQSFFEKFDLFADAPGALAKMRELVLRLAFSGGLTGKRPTDDGVPTGWEIRTIESISASIFSGFACSRSHQVESGHVHLRTHNISTLGTLNFDLLVRIDPKMVDAKKASIRAGDILFNNTNSQELVGKTSLVDRDYDYGFSNHITRIRLKDGIFPGFVVFYLTLLRNSGYFARLCTRWINQAAVNTDTLKEQTIPLPPLAEQKRIVAKVDELLALCDRLESQQQERETRHAALARASLARFADAPTPANLQFLFHSSFNIQPSDLRKSILTLAVQGKLVPQDPCDEPVFVLSNSEFDVAFDVPENWAWIRLANLQPEFQNGASSRGDKNGTPVIVIRLADIENKRISLDNPRAIAISIDQIAKYSLQFGDTLITRVNGSADIVGTFIPVQDSLDAIYCDHFIRMRIDPERLFPAFTALVGDSPLVREQIRSLFITTAGQKTVNQGHIRSLCIPLPPLAEQRRIVAKVEQLMALVDELETQLAASRATAVNLLSALVAELTAQV